jgi:hypothetical protein
MLARCSMVVLALAAAGCAVQAGGAEPVGYVLLDHEARAAGRLAQEGWSEAPALPVALPLGDPVAYTSSTGRTLIDLREGMLAHVHGAAGAVEWLGVGTDLEPDELRVQGTEAAARELAKRVAGKVEGGGAGPWTIAAPDLFDRASFLAVPDGITDVAPSLRVGGIGQVAALGQADAPGEVLGPVGEAFFVGVYVSGFNALILDASGGFSLESACDGSVLQRGRYRADGARLVLESEAAPMVFSLENGRLSDDGGTLFEQLVPVLPAAPKDTHDDEGGEP